MLMIFTVASVKTFAQENFKVGISMGQVLPLNEFKNNNYKNMPAGFSQSGFTLNFDGDYYFIHRLAVSARFNFGLSSMDKVAVADWLDHQMADYLNSNAENNLYSVDYWQWSAPLLGIKYNYPIVVNKFYFEVAGFSGLSIVQTPNQNLKIIDDVNKQDIYSENVESKTISLPLMFDGSFRYMATKNIQLKLQTSYFQTKASYEHVNYIVKENSIQPEELQRATIDVPLKTLSVSLGIIYNL